MFTLPFPNGVSRKLSFFPELSAAGGCCRLGQGNVLVLVRMEHEVLLVGGQRAASQVGRKRDLPSIEVQSPVTDATTQRQDNRLNTPKHSSPPFGFSLSHLQPALQRVSSFFLSRFARIYNKGAARSTLLLARPPYPPSLSRSPKPANRDSPTNERSSLFVTYIRTNPTGPPETRDATRALPKTPQLY